MKKKQKQNSNSRKIEKKHGGVDKGKKSYSGRRQRKK